MDPWNWTVDDVVLNLCHSRELWSDRATATLPEPKQFEEILRENDIDGPTLLEDVDKTSLASELGIKSVGQRSSIVLAITKLRIVSKSYTEKHGWDQLTRAGSASDSMSNFLRPNSVESGNTSTLQIRPEVNDVKAAGDPFVDAEKGKIKRRRVEPTHVQEPAPARTFAPLSKAEGRPTQGSVSLDDIFYGYRQQGDEMGDSDSENDFTYTRDKMCTHQTRKMIANRLKHSFLQHPLVLDSERTVIYPYPERLVLPNNKRSATMIKTQAGKVSMTKCDAVTLEDAPMGNEGGENSEWDFLIQRYPPKHDDEGLPLYNDSGSEGEYEGSLVDELEVEDDERDKKQESKKKELTSDQVDELIALAIDEIIGIWREKKLPHRKRIAWKTWHECQGRKRTTVVQATKFEMERLERRLSNLKRQIHTHTWTNSAEVRNQCGILDQTVSDKLDLQWKLELWTMDEPPRQIKSITKTQKTAKPPPDNDADESLGSESEHMGDFIESDDGHGIDDHKIGDDPSYRDLSRNLSGFESHLGNDAEQQARATIREANDNNILKEEDENMEDVATHNTVTGQCEVIDLTFSSPAGMSPEPTNLRPTSSTLDSPDISPEQTDQESTTPRYDPFPLESSLSEIAEWTYKELEHGPDRKRLVLKLLCELDIDTRRAFVRRINLLPNEGFHALERMLDEALDCVRSGSVRLKGLNEQDSRRVKALGRLYLCWMKGGRQFMDQFSLVSDKHYEEARVSIWDHTDPANWAQFLKDAMNPEGPFAGDIKSEDTEEPTPMKRGKPLQKNQTGVELRQQARDRLKHAISRRALRKASPTQRVSEASFRYIVNANADHPIYIHERVSKFLKPHQVEGVRFMWRELIDVSSTGGLPQGCLLAHTMGLGKTLQTITLLLTLASASISEDVGIASQIPEMLKDRRTLILCPAHLVENWKDELDCWAPGESATLGHIFDMSSQTTSVDIRLETIRSWISDRGILIISYEMFRNLTGGGQKKSSAGGTQKKSAASGTQKRKKQAVDEETQLQFRDWLLNGPSIVVADEAHRLKNQDGSLGSLVTEFGTKSRVALTASPLANNLQEYFAMVDWIAPQYLGSQSEFIATYQKPIEEGLYNDSTLPARHESHSMLDRLKRIIEPKVSRADMSVLKDTLEPKTEFVIKVSLTAIQKLAYSKFLELIRRGEGEISNTRFWHWIALLGLLCVHPMPFYIKLEEYHKNGSYQVKKTSNAFDAPLAPSGLDEAEDPGENLQAVEVPQGMYETFRDLFSINITNLQSSSLSHKLECIAQILQESKGESVLIFSHHLHTLRHLEAWVKSSGLASKTASLNGESKDRHTLAKAFNDGKYDILFVSTRAGGTGINLQRASRVILMDLQFNPQHEEQAIGRAFRLGQTKRVYVYRLITYGTFEEELYKRAWFKRQLSGSVVDNKKMESRAARPKDYLFEPVDKGGQDLDPFKGTDSVLDAVLGSYVGSAIREIERTESLREAATGEGDEIFNKAEYPRGSQAFR
ncbi:MAG: hypothetical protein M1831_002923 [Alyxoria varia]|nr:MAG: hypothetical protein M1831_002923 [Alyxoria varia]